MKPVLTISTCGPNRSKSRSCATCTATPGPQQARFWLAGVKARKAGLVDRPEQWEWSSFRSYLFGETGLVRVKFQEWPLEIKGRPVATFGEGNGASLPLVRGGPLIRKERE
jgi:hypothetical protein